MAALFGGLAATVFSLKGNQTNDISEVTEDGDYIDFEGNFGPYYGEDKGGWK